MILHLLIVVASAFSVACLATYLLLRSSDRFRILDYPNERSLHNVPVPRTGGVAIMIGALGGIGVALAVLGVKAQTGWIAAAVLLVGTTAFLDDIFHVPVSLRLTVQVMAASVVVAGGLEIQSSWLVGPHIDMPAVFAPLLSIVFIVWMTNLYNFMDGIDGLAGGMAAFGFGTFAALGWLAGDYAFGSLALAVAGAAVGFLIFNFPPARIFMGDTGSSTLGLLAGTLMLWGARDGIFSFWVGVLIFSPFIVDATITLIRRMLHGDKIWIAHKSHYYQRVVQLGWGHKKTTLAAYLLMMSTTLSAIGAVDEPPSIQWGILIMWSGIYAALIFYIKKSERRVDTR